MCTTSRITLESSSSAILLQVAITLVPSAKTGITVFIFRNSPIWAIDDLKHFINCWNGNFKHFVRNWLLPCKAILVLLCTCDTSKEAVFVFDKSEFHQHFLTCCGEGDRCLLNGNLYVRVQAHHFLSRCLPFHTSVVVLLHHRLHHWLKSQETVLSKVKWRNYLSPTIFLLNNGCDFFCYNTIFVKPTNNDLFKEPTM